jgi:NAD(P)H dehydrogenase (quinone)
MNALIIYANYKPHSFNFAVKDLLAETFHKHGSNVVIRDLYDIKFNPVLSREDLESIDDSIYPPDIMEEQKFIEWADIICFAYPIWWSGMPAILKGYIERVFLEGFAYKFVDEKPVPKLTNKKAMLFNTTGSKLYFENKDQHKALNLITEKSILGFCGIEVVEHKYYPNVSKVSKEERMKYLKEIEETVRNYLK